jgi:2-polyprenyl-6-hydroxyphenyl methylase / 3-demethylubiquinone-9 3-methyltransferase
MKKKYSKEEIRNMYDASYAESYNKQDTVRIERFLKHFEFNPTDIIADFACGNGLLLQIVHDKIKHYFGIDFSKEQIQFANKRIVEKNINNATFVCSGITEFCKENPNSFDKAFALDFTEHIYDEDLIVIFQNIKESLKDGGKLYVHTPNGNYILEVLKNNGILKQIPQHIAVRNAAQYINLFINKIEFKNITIRYISHYHSFLRKFHFLSHLPWIGKFFQARLLLICQIGRAHV